jgi:metallo-beta-lactamase family protein
MKITFVGATGTVMGSKYLVEDSGRLLVDCGLFQGYKQLRLRNRAELPVAVRTLDAVILKHGEPDAADALRLRIEERLGWRVEIPEYLERVSLT